ncbi:alpha/beta fold hydrolase [Falsirhodobacter halotolerans]|uniref:alpha/beta fold hydrolase n=1 Tax=Falsirhodobacter halotolerans TaxID=1146892 RepID=UPI001FD459EC|nr:alpha/beta hydrolase [Falsirhodobacter halotolerans]MCJ8139367.1 alpha/beta hydrolase [Falsirhodobacter halotolerans]
MIRQYVTGGTTLSVKLNINEYGPENGRPVVLIHGWPLSGESWEKQIPALEGAGFRVIAYDRRGFGQSEKPSSGYDYDTLASDLSELLEARNLRDVTLVGFSMGGGEVARYMSRYGRDRIHSVVFASAVPPYMLKTDDNPDGPLTKEKADEMESNLRSDRNAFFDQFTTEFFSVGSSLKVDQEDRQKAIELCRQSDQTAALECMKAFGTTDFRGDLPTVIVPTLVLHGAGDGTVPFEGSGKRTHAAIPGSELVVIPDAPHGCNVSHPEEFNTALLEFLRR